MHRGAAQTGDDRGRVQGTQEALDAWRPLRAVAVQAFRVPASPMTGAGFLPQVMSLF